MKRDISQIEQIRKSFQEEIEDFFNQIINSLEITLLSYSFLDEKIKNECLEKTFLEALNTYQEKTPVLFNVYFTKSLNQALINEAEKWKKQKNISYSIPFLRYITLSLFPLENQTYVTKMEMTNFFGAQKLLEFEKQFQRIKSKEPQALAEIFKDFQKDLKAKALAQKKFVKATKEKSELTPIEKELLKLYLGIEDDICKDVQEIVKEKNLSPQVVSSNLQSAFYKLEHYLETKQSFLDEFPNCRDIYTIRMKTIDFEKIGENKKVEEDKVPSNETRKRVLLSEKKKTQIEVSPLLEKKEQEEQKKPLEKKVKVKKKETASTTIPKERKSPSGKKETQSKKVASSKKDEAKRKEEKKQPQKSESKEKLSKKEQTSKDVILLFFQLQLTQDEHGFFPTYKEIKAKMKTITPRKYSTYLSLASQEETRKQVASQIENFDALLNEFMGLFQKEELTETQLLILEQELYFDQDGKVKNRSPQELAKIISRNGLRFDEEYIQFQKKLIYQKIRKNEGLNERVHKIKEVYLLALDKEKEEKRKQELEKKKRQEREEEFRKENEALRIQKIIQRNITYFKKQLKQDKEGFFKAKQDVLKQLGLDTSHSIFDDIQASLQKESFLIQYQQAIPNFDILLNEFLDTQTRKKLSQRRMKILDLLTYRDKEGHLKIRSNQEIAEQMSTDILHFSADYVALEKKTIYSCFEKRYPELKRRYCKEHPDFKMRFLTEKSLENNQVQKQNQAFACSLLRELFKQDEEGFFKSKAEVGRIYNLEPATVRYYFSQIFEALKNEQTKEMFAQEIPNFNLLLEEYLDSSKLSTLTNRQQTILSILLSSFESEPSVIRSNQEIAEEMSKDGLTFKEGYVKKQLENITYYFQQHPQEKEAFLKEHPLVLEKKEELLRAQKTSSLPTEDQINYLKRQMEQNSDGFLLPMKAVQKQLQFDALKTAALIDSIQVSLSQRDYHTAICEQIPNFDARWEYFRDNQKKGIFTDQEQKIIMAQTFFNENGRIFFRNEKELADIISGNGLHFSEKYIKAKKKTIIVRQESNPALKIMFEQLRQDNTYRLSKEEIAYLQYKYEFQSQENQYPTEQDRYRKFSLREEELRAMEASIHQKLQISWIREPFFQKSPNLEEAHYIYWNYQTLPQEESSSLEEARLHLNQSYFQSFVKNCSEQAQTLLALRFGYFNHHVYSTKEAAKSCGYKVKEATCLIHDCIQEKKESLEKIVLQKKYKK